MKKFALILVVLVVVILWIRSGKDPAPPAPRPAAKAEPVPQPATATQVAKNLTPAWPPARNDAAALSADLFARNYYVVLDASGSMNESRCSGVQTKMEVAKAALASFAQTVPAHANLGLLVFDSSGVRERLPLGIGNREAFAGQLAEVRANGNTPLRRAVTLGYEKLQAQGAKQLGYGEYHLVVVTDGAADQGQDPTPAVNKMLAESPVVLQTIGFCIGTEHSLNQAGRTIYRAADNVDALRQGLADVLAEAPQFAVTQFK